VSYNIGALYGAGLFVAAAVVSICIFQSSEAIQYEKGIIYRDIGIYILSTIAVIIFAVCSAINWVAAVVLLLIYVGLVVVVLIQEKMQTPAQGGDDGNELAGQDGPPKDDEDNKPVKGLTQALLAVKKATVQLVAVVSFGQFLKHKLTMKKERKKKKEGRTLLEWFKLIVEMPVNWLFYLTALPVEEDNYSRNRALVWVPFGVYLWIWCFTKEWYGMIYLEVWLPLVIVLYALFLTTLTQEAPRWFMFFTVVGVVAGLMYTYIFCGILIDMLNTFGVLLCLDNTYLGLTILAVGNALPDALTTVSLCAAGNATMAISGGYAGQLFGLLVGFGLSMLKVTLSQGTQTFDLFNPASINENLLDLLVVFTALIILVFTFLWGVFNNFRMNRVFATIMLIIYACFFIACTIVALCKAVANY